MRETVYLNFAFHLVHALVKTNSIHYIKIR